MRPTRNLESMRQGQSQETVHRSRGDLCWAAAPSVVSIVEARVVDKDGGTR
jgi:hypothetical protein